MQLGPEDTIIYQEIVDGYSKVTSEDLTLFIKHMDSKMNAHLESIFLFHYNRLRESGLKTEKEMLEFLKEQEMWSEKRELEIKEKEKLIDTLNRTKAKQFKISQKRMIEEQIEAQELAIEKIRNEKKELIGITADDLARKKKNIELIKISLFIDENLTVKLFDSEESTNEELNNFFDIYSNNNERISERRIKKIALSSYCINNFILCNDNPYHFFDKPISKLTFNQSSLLHHIKKYINIFKEIGYDKIPFEVREDPDRLVDWFEVNKNAEDIKKKTGNGGIVGGTKEDQKAIGMVSNNDMIIKKLKEKGGSMGIYEYADEFGGEEADIQSKRK